MTALKAHWIVTAETLPGQLMREYTRIWHYTSGELHEDRCMTQDQESNFERHKREAMEYALQLQDPSMVNVVHLQFCWL